MTFEPDTPAEPTPEPAGYEEPVLTGQPEPEPEPDKPVERRPGSAGGTVRRIFSLLLLAFLVVGAILLTAYLTYYRPLAVERTTLVDEVRQLNSDLTDTTARLETAQGELANLEATEEATRTEFSRTQVNQALFRLQTDVLTVRLGLATGDSLSARTSLRLAEEDISALRQLNADEELVTNLEQRLNEARTALEGGDEEAAQDALRSLSEDIRTIDRP